MPSGIIIETQGTKAVLAQIRKYMSAEALAQGELKALAEYTRSVAYSLAPKDTGGGARRIQAAVVFNRAEVFTKDAHMVVMEMGRRPGAAAPPTEALAGWMARHGKPQSEAFVVARAIGRRGLRARRFMARAAEAAKTKLDVATRNIKVKLER
jgi:hypothetical protein